MAEQLIKIAAQRQLTRRRADRHPDRRLRRVRRALPLRRDRGPARRDRRGVRRPHLGPGDGPAGLRRRRLRQDRGRAARRLRGGDVGQAGRGRRADDAAVAPALQDLQGALRRPAGPGRAGLAPGRRRRAEGRPRRASPSGKVDIVIGTHALLSKSIKFKDLGLLVIDEEQHFGVGHKERLKELARQRPRADADRDADPAHAAAGADRRARPDAAGDAAGRPARDPHLHLALRSAHRSARRCCAKSIAAGRRSTSCRKIKDQPDIAEFLRAAGARGQLRRRQRPDAGGRARRHHEQLLRRQVRRAGVDDDRRIRPRHPQRQHADRPPRRPVRPRAALPDPRPHRPVQAARLCAVHGAAGPQADRHRRAPARRAAVARNRSAPASSSRATTSISAGRATCSARSSPAISAKSASSSTRRCWRRRCVARAGGTGDVEYEDKSEWSPQISLGMPVMIPEHYVPDLQLRMQLYRRLGDLDGRARDRCGRRRADRPLRAAAGGSRGAAQGHPRQGALPHRQCREGRGRPQGRGRHLPQQRVPRSGGPRRDGLRSRAGRCASGPTRSSASPATGRPPTRGSRGRRRSSRAWRSWPKAAAPRPQWPVNAALRGLRVMLLPEFHT